MRVSVLFAALLALAPAPAAAQSDAVQALVGAWEISNADRDRACGVTFRAEATAGGFRLDLDRAACAAAFPPLKDVAAWSLVGDDTVRLVDGKGQVLFEFTEVESGLYESLRPGQPLTFLQTAAAAGPPARTPEQVAGDWHVVRGGGAPICTLTLLTAPAGNDDFALRVKPGCDRSLVRFGLAAWQMDRGELLLKSSRGQTWRFEDSAGAWQRIPEGAEPMMLVKP